LIIQSLRKLPTFYGHNNVDEYLGWKQRHNDVTKLEILNWSELKVCMRKKNVPPSYVEKKEVEKEKIKTIGKIEKCLATSRKNTF